MFRAWFHFAHLGAVGFRRVQPGDTPAEYDDPAREWRDAFDLQGISDAIDTLFDMWTGDRHFDRRNLPEVGG